MVFALARSDDKDTRDAAYDHNVARYVLTSAEGYARLAEMVFYFLRVVVLPD